MLIADLVDPLLRTVVLLPPVVVRHNYVGQLHHLGLSAW
jgi:hypothetical protein